jgi:ABC-type Fe3+-hydroxamate transport system substrate-binding protein
MIITSTQFSINPPQRIISLVPSQSELLYSLGLDKEVVGITKFCVHPQQWFKTKTRVGGTKNINIDLIKKLHPDLIIANKEENVKEQIEELAKEFTVWVTDVNSVEDAFLMIKDVGELTYKNIEATKLITQISRKFSNLQTNMPQNQSGNELKGCYLIWQDPYMTIGGDTFINDMMKHCGLQNLFKNQTRYPEITLEELKTANCQLILLSSEPYPFNQKHLDELHKLLPGKKIFLVDGEMFSWYGSRLILAPEYFKTIFRLIQD